MNAIYQWFTEPFAYPFMQNALITALLVSIICAMLSCYLVLKGWSLMGDAISHAVLPGIVVAFWLSLPLTIGAFVAGLLCSVCVGYLKENSRIKEDTAMGIVFSGMFALGIVLFSKIETDQHLTHILFGNLLGVSDAEMLQTLVISAVVFGVVFLRRKDFLLYCFDATQGVILVVAMLISPGITAFILSKRFDHMIVIALATSISTSIFGTIISYHIDGATGPCIILLQAAVFLIALIYSKIKLRFSVTLETP